MNVFVRSCVCVCVCVFSASKIRAMYNVFLTRMLASIMWECPHTEARADIVSMRIPLGYIVCVSVGVAISSVCDLFNGLADFHQNLHECIIEVSQ